MSRKRKISTNISPTIKLEIKEENIDTDDVLIARGRLKGALQELIEHSDEGSGTSGDESRKNRYRLPRKRETETSRNYNRIKRRRSYSSPPATAFHHTYVMKLFDRSVDLARFEEDTPLYPICRAWMANQPRNPQLIVKRRASTPDEMDFEHGLVTDRYLREVNRLPPPSAAPISRVPSPLPEQFNQQKEDINLNYDEQPPVPKDELIRNHLQRWARVKQKWITQANKNEERFDSSFQVLAAIYNKAQENME